MTDSATHYRVLLAKHYSWMLGRTFEDAVTEQRREFAALGIGAGEHGLAVDLGCGPGHQAAALSDLGFSRVLALDTSQILLDELIRHKGERPTNHSTTRSPASLMTPHINLQQIDYGFSRFHPKPTPLPVRFDGLNLPAYLKRPYDLPNHSL